MMKSVFLYCRFQRDVHLFFEVQIDVHFNSLSSYTVGFKGMCICFLKFRLTFILTLCLPILSVSKGCAGAGIAQLVVLGLAAKVSRVRYSSGDIFW